MTVVKIENLSKRYYLSHDKSNPYASLREILANWCKNSYQKMRHPFSYQNQEVTQEEFWALQEVNLNFEEGDRVAILGHNGAGKSTLLKLISRITEPTSGRITIRGRVSSLLEVGTGFHPDLTGRENILLNGAIMGMSYQEIRRKFDEIVAFADIEKFLDTQIKHYSSGMYMRLGFAVAAHLNADLLIVDEILAVGDAQFQDKCIKKMNEFGTQGKTVIFVSHNTNTVLSLCNKGILLEKGRVVAAEPIENCINRYIKSCPTGGLHWQGEIGDEHISVNQFFLNPPSTHTDFFMQNEKTQLNLKCDILKPHNDLIIAFSVLNTHKQIIARSRLCDHPEFSEGLTSGQHHLSADLDLSLFHPGEYSIRLEIALLNKKKITNDEITLKFNLYSKKASIKVEKDKDKSGISLGNFWSKH